MFICFTFIHFCGCRYQRFPAYSNELGFIVAPFDLPWEICEFANLPEVLSLNLRFIIINQSAVITNTCLCDAGQIS
jgi:hypothetical protein